MGANLSVPLNVRIRRFHTGIVQICVISVMSRFEMLFFAPILVHQGFAATAGRQEDRESGIVYQYLG